MLYFCTCLFFFFLKKNGFLPIILMPIFILKILEIPTYVSTYFRFLPKYFRWLHRFYRYLYLTFELSLSHRQECTAIGRIAGQPGADEYCQDKCLVYGSQCPRDRCACYWLEEYENSQCRTFARQKAIQKTWKINDLCFGRT